MITLTSIFLLSLRGMLQTDILFWVFVIPALLSAVALLCYQWRKYRRMKASLEQLARVKRHPIEYELVLKTMKLCVWHFDIESRIVTFESDYRDSYGGLFPASGITMEDVISNLLPQYVDEVRRGMDDLIAGRTDEFHVQYQIKAPQSNSTYWGEGYATVERRGLDGKPLAIVGTIMRIDKQKEIEQALIEARNHAEESDRLKSAFLANMSHEIRTPLNAIVGFSEVLCTQQGDEMEEREQIVALIRQNNAHLLRLFDDMVNMSKLEAGGATLTKERFELNRLLTDVVEKYAEESAASGVKLKIEAMAEDPMPYTDRSRLFEILSQYVDNAMKFTAEGSVTLGYSVHSGLLKVWVRDTGKGIAEEYCGDRLFERFVKIDDFVPGTGLGLSICRSLALSLGGSVGVESKLGEGSLFWVELSVS